MALPRPASPRRALGDLRAVLARRGKHQLIAGGLAIVLPAVIVLGFLVDAKTNTAPPRRQLIYLDSWPADRTDAEIVAQQKIDKVAKDKAAVERRQAYQRLEKRLGI